MDGAADEGAGKAARREGLCSFFHTGVSYACERAAVVMWQSWMCFKLYGCILVFHYLIFTNWRNEVD